MSCDYRVIESSFLKFPILYYTLSINSFGFTKPTEKAPSLVKYLFVVPFFQIHNDRIGMNKIISLWKALWAFKMKMGPNILGKSTIIIFCKNC